jgi:hypothetical protein
MGVDRGIALGQNQAGDADVRTRSGFSGSHADVPEVSQEFFGRVCAVYRE